MTAAMTAAGETATVPTAAAVVLVAAALLVIPSSVARTRVRSWRTAGGERCAGSTGRRRNLPAGSIVAATAAGAAMLAVLVGWAPAAAAAIVGGTALHVRTRRAAARRHEREADNLALALEIVAAELKTGAHPGSACATASAQIPSGDVARRLDTAAAHSQLGGSVSRSLADGDGVGTDGDSRAEQSGDGSARRVSGDGSWSRIAAVWSVAERRGIALADLLDAARRDLQVRVSFRHRREAGLSGARSTAMVLAALPVLGVGFGCLMGAHPLQVLTGGGLGGLVLVGGVLLDCAGLVWAERIGSGGGGNGAGKHGAAAGGGGSW